MTQNVLQNDRRKFFFDVNIFDEKQEPEEPPPPMFSEAEIEAARLKALAEGKSDGIRESAESRAEKNAAVLEKISRDFASLFAAEAAREKRYEREAVELCYAVFRKLYPLYEKTAGLSELKKAVENVLRLQEGKSMILVHVAPAAAEEISKHLASLNSAGIAGFEVRADESVADGACRLAWADGGAVRDSAQIAQRIEETLKDLLAGNGVKAHD